ncbi:MAG: polyprenyl synthetase family protein [Bacteriovoracaceae bacterium]
MEITETNPFIDKFIKIKPTLEGKNHFVQEILNNYLSYPGKQVRPILCKLIGGMFQLPQNQIELIARAAEMIHNASLIHDDVIDEAVLRRQRETLNFKYTNSQAVLSGDFLLARVIKELVTAKQYDILNSLSSTLEDLVEGEIFQDQLKNKTDIQKIDLIYVAKKKTGSLMGWTFSAPLEIQNLDRESIELANTIGVNLGLVFQMIDDNLDFLPNTGKVYSKDLTEGLINFTLVNLIELYPETYFPIHQARGQNLKIYPWTDSQIDEAIKKSKKDAQFILEKINKDLDKLKEGQFNKIDEDHFQHLKLYIHHLQERNL